MLPVPSAAIRARLFGDEAQERTRLRHCSGPTLTCAPGRRGTAVSPKLTKRILRLLRQPKAWTIGRLYQRLGRPAISLRTPAPPRR